jgi:hypothetical protein
VLDVLFVGSHTQTILLVAWFLPCVTRVRG